MLRVNLTASNKRKLSRHADQVHSMPNPEGSIVEENMVVGTKTQQVSEIVGSIVRPAQRTNVRGSGVGPTGAVQ
jgi:hypothetical protein